MDIMSGMPVKIIRGKGCIGREYKALALGKRAFIVCGRHGAAACGALGDVTAALGKLGIGYTLFDKSRENPPLELCMEGGRECAADSADFVIGIGGGSALDAAKAVALFAKNPQLDGEKIFDKSLKKAPPLPLVAIPTTSGTGSEANATGVLTLPGGLVKKSFASEFPRVSFLDPNYTASLPYRTALSCVLDAFAHATESYLSPKATEASREAAVFAAKSIWSIIKDRPVSFGEKEREELQLAACAAGYAISITGTGFPHPLGYSLTTFDGVPHGFACAAFYKSYIGYNLKVPAGKKLLGDFCREALGTSSPEDIADLIPSLAGVKLSMTAEGIEERVSLIKDAKNFGNSPYVLNDEEKLAIYSELFLQK